MVHEMTTIDVMVMGTFIYQNSMQKTRNVSILLPGLLYLSYRIYLNRKKTVIYALLETYIGMLITIYCYFVCKIQKESERQTRANG
jgi:predicted ATP-grasp superfamily ATP-dependent carboligase